MAATSRMDAAKAESRFHGKIGRVDAPARDGVDLGPSLECAHPVELDGRRRNDQLSALVECDAVLAAEVLGGAFTGPAESGLQAARLVVDPGVDDAAVMTGLEPSDTVLGLEHHHGGVGIANEQPVRGRQSDDACADDGIGEVRAHPTSVASPRRERSFTYAWRAPNRTWLRARPGVVGPRVDTTRADLIKYQVWI